MPMRRGRSKLVLYKTEVEHNSVFKNKQDCYKEETDELFFMYTKGWMEIIDLHLH